MTNTDYELTKTAARAAGMTVQLSLGLAEGDAMFFDAATGKPFAPLTDDGDALRLAVKLRIDFCIDPDETMACAWCEPISDFMQDDLATDEMAATRRAIVRAAAALAAKGER